MSNRSHFRRRGVLLAGSLTAALVTSAPAARADGTETDRQIAQSLFDDGRALMEGGHVSEACPRFAESQRLDPGGGTLLNLALCHELEGKTATAWTEFRDALSLALRDDRKDRQALANLHITELAPKLTRLMVLVPAGVALRDPEVSLDSSRLPVAAWSTAIPVDPGDHRIAVAAKGLPAWETSIATREAGRTYRVEIPAALESRGALSPEPHDSRQRSTAFWLVLGGAGVSLTASVITGLMALHANSYVNDNCYAARDYCRVDDAQEAASRARTLAWVSTATLVAGAGAAVLAFVLPLDRKSSVSAGILTQDGAAFATLKLAPRLW